MYSNLLGSDSTFSAFPINTVFLHMSLIPISTKRCRQRFAVCLQVSRSATNGNPNDLYVELIPIHFESPYRFLDSITGIGDRVQPQFNFLQLFRCSFLKRHELIIFGKTQIEPIWPCSMTGFRCHDYLQLSHHLHLSFPNSSVILSNCFFSQTTSLQSC